MVVEEHWKVSGEAGDVREETNLELSSDISLSSCQKHSQSRGLSTLGYQEIFAKMFVILLHNNPIMSSARLAERFIFSVFSD